MNTIIQQEERYPVGKYLIYNTHTGESVGTNNLEVALTLRKKLINIIIYKLIDEDMNQ